MEGCAEGGGRPVLCPHTGHFALGGHHVQFNVVDGATLRKAQANPSEYRNLLVRVAGYSDYFVDLDLDHQEEIIHRTEQEMA